MSSTSNCILPQEDSGGIKDKNGKSNKILRCRKRYAKRKFYRNLIESSKLQEELDNRPFVKIKILNEDLTALLDSGASVSVLGKNSREFLQRNHLSLKPFSSYISTADGSRRNVIGHCNVPVTFKNVTKYIDFYIVPALTQEVYLGVDFWRAFALAPQIIPVLACIDGPEIEYNGHSFHKLTSDEQIQLESVLLQFRSYEQYGLGCTNLLEHHIDTGEAVPIKAKHYPLSPPRQKEVYDELDRLIKLGVIEESNSPWCSPIVNIRKPGKVRLCLDSRRLNALTKKDSYPLPHINGLLSRLKDTYFISGIDLKDAFFQIKLSESSKEKTAFAVPGRPLYQYRVMPFGLCNGPQTMSRLMDKVIPSRLRENVFIYLDDLLVCSSSFESHLALLSEVAKCLTNANLTINLGKSKFCQKEIKYLGYRIGNGCLKVDPDKVDAIRNFPQPKSPRQLRRFMGMANWYRGFIQNFADLSGPMTDCLRKTGKPFALTPEAIVSFGRLKDALCSAPVLAQPDFSKEFVIQCDASRVGVGGVLFQISDEGVEKPIAFVSKKLNKAQRNYTVTELECLAAIVSVNRFRPYIEGLPFKIITDHSSLKWLMTQKDLSGRLARWSLKLQRYDFRMEHRKGSLNVVPDTLSRFDVDEIDLRVSFPEIDLESDEFDSLEYTNLRKVVSEAQSSLPDLKISGKHVYKRVKFRTGSENEEDNLWRLWLPASMKDQVIRKAHDSSCHGGYFKTLSRARLFYFWPKMAADIRDFIGKCDDCKAIKPVNTILKPPMGNAFVTVRPFQRLYCDFLGPYPCSKRKNTQLLIILDHFTKFVFLYPMRAATSTNTIDILQNQIFYTFGVPQFLHSDNGRQFISKEMKEFLDLHGITHIKTGLYSPQANAAERVNREIVSKIRYMLKEEKDHTNWDKCIPKILAVLRGDHHSAIECSPYYAVFGQNMCLHGFSFNLLNKLNLLSDDTIVKHVDRMSMIRDKISQNLDSAHQKANKTYNLRTRVNTFEKGQIVFRKNHALSNMQKGINAKFLPKFKKCKIRKKIGNCLYDLEDLNGNLIGRYHASDIRK